MHLQCCLNGTRRPRDHPALPVTAAAIGADAASVARAGAASVHVHPRTGGGLESLEPEHVAAAVTAIRRACPGLACGVTTAAWVAPDPERRLAAIAAWTVLPDFASVNLGEPGALAVIDLLCARGIEVEAGVWSEADARDFVAGGLDGACLRVLVEVEPNDDASADPDKAVSRAAAIDLILDDGLVECPRLHHGMGRATWAVIESALERGHDVRIGLEDTLVLPDGSVARDNAELVAEAGRLAAAAGRLLERAGGC